MLPLKSGPAFDIGDLTDVACQVPSDSVHHAGAICELLGPGRFTAHEPGAVIERAVGKPSQVQKSAPTPT